MAEPDTPASPDARVPWKRYLMIGLPIAVMVGAFLLFFYDRIAIQGYINKLHSTQVAVRREQLDALKSHPDVELVNELLADSIADDNKTFGVRTACANLLLERQRLPALEQLFAKGDILTRGVVIKVFAQEKWFQGFVDDQEGRVQQTIDAWLDRANDPTRSHAIQLAVRLDLQDAMAKIDPLLHQPASPNIHPESQRSLLIAAAGAAERFKNCASVPRIAELAETHEDYLVRLRAMQIVDRMAFRKTPEAACAGAIDADRMKAIVMGALEDKSHEVRMASMLVLARHKVWAALSAGRLQEILDSDVKPPERRQALETLVSLGAPAFLERLPSYFHDTAREVRSSCVRASLGAPVPLVGCLIGLTQDETENEQLFHDALAALRKRAGKWAGLPLKYALRFSKDRPGFQKSMSTLFTRGEVEDVTRQGMVDQWFLWWSEELGLDEAQAQKALEARTAFHAAKERLDTQAAEAALDAAGIDVPGLFCYERGWLISRDA